MKNIILFGANGMLGYYVKTYLSNFYNIIPFTRNEFDIESCNWNRLYSILSFMNQDDVLINCAGAIPQRNDDIKKNIVLNTLFPHKVNEFAKSKNIKFIHITTNCVFSGKRGNYIETDEDYGDSVYDITKLLGEPEETCIIRTSIIGQEKTNKKSLLEWVISKKNEEIDGYTNVFWNGITCLQLAKIIQKMIDENIFWKGIRHIYSPNTVSKYQLCKIINDVYKLNIKMNEKTEPVQNLTLASIYEIPFEIPLIQTQVKELRGYTP